MFIASAHAEEDEHTEKHELVPHDFILSGATGKPRKCVVQDTRRKDRWLKLGEWPMERRDFQTRRIRRGCELRAEVIQWLGQWPGS
jgi:hypothetical protein